jgi:flagellar basal-body rod modification protein FlgD
MSSIRTVSSIGANPLTQATSKSQSAQNQKDQFLTLLATQLQNQNPLEPINSSDFTAQLAQFSTLEGIQNLNTNFTDMLKLQELTQGANLVGKKIQYAQTGVTGLQSGVVSGVSLASDGSFQALVGNKQVGLGQIQGVVPS